MVIRTIAVNDAKQFLELRKQLENESLFMLLEPEERQTTIEQQIEDIRRVVAADNQTIFVAEIDSELVGFLAVFGGSVRRNRNSASVVVGVRQLVAGQGIGTRLFLHMEKWALQHAIHRLELTVMTHNERAIALYTKMGFKIEGTKKHSLFVGGRYVDEHCMAKLLQNE